MDDDYETYANNDIYENLGNDGSFKATIDHQVSFTPSSSSASSSSSHSLTKKVVKRAVQPPATNGANASVMLPPVPSQTTLLTQATPEPTTTSDAASSKTKGKRKSRNSSPSSDDEDADRTVSIKEFDLNSIPPFKSTDEKGVKIVCIGKSGSGKSTIIQALLASKAHIAPVIQVFNGTEEANGTFSKICPPCFIFDKLDLNALIQFKNRQTIAGRNLENPWAIQIIDDCTDDPKQLTHPIIQAYYKNGRHWRMIHILSTQFCLDIKPNIRSNIDYVFICKEDTKKNRKKLYENYCPDCVESFEDFCVLMDVLTQNYTALVINYKAATNKIEDMIFYFKADPNAVSPAWRFGHMTAWEFNNERFDPNYIEPIIKP